MNLIINNITIKLITLSIPIVFQKELYHENDCIFINNIKTDINIDSGNVYLEENGNKIFLGYGNIIYNKNNYKTIKIFTNDLLNKYKEILYFFNNNPTNIMDCFSINTLCNLNCYYCCENNKNNIKIQEYYIVKIFCNQIHKIFCEVYNKDIKAKYHRYMGGETFLYPKLLKNMIKLFNTCNSKGEDTYLHLYTNATIINTDKYIKDIINMNYYNNYSFWITMDSLDYKKSFRIQNQELMNIHKNIINNISKLTQKYDTLTCFNIMYIDDLETINIMKYLKSINLHNYKLGFDDSLSGEYINYRIKKKAYLNEQANKIGMIEKKKKIENNFPVFLILTSFGKEIYKRMTEFIISENVIEIFKK